MNLLERVEKHLKALTPWFTRVLRDNAGQRGLAPQLQVFLASFFSLKEGSSLCFYLSKYKSLASQIVVIEVAGMAVKYQEIGVMVLARVNSNFPASIVEYNQFGVENVE